LVVPESLEFSFQMVSEGTSAEKATVRIHEVAARLRCKPCGAETEVTRPPFQCVRCGATDVEVVSGDQVLVDAVELENGEVIRRCIVPADEILEEHMKEHHGHGAAHGKAAPS
jgi:hypothetical protein